MGKSGKPSGDGRLVPDRDRFSRFPALPPSDAWPPTRALVASLGHRATTAGDGREALGLLESTPFDLVLLDLMMPEMNGHEVLERMKGASRLREIPVIMISGLDEIQAVVRCIQQGAEDYLSKPYERSPLRDCQ
ncbi:Response regulator receiver domain-containing protein [Singulisphaera sp. GP187]|uniref:response regulator n=1 Tax=Singulisphaera sp. GP187 TaxID=1882752 RepID=UPI00092A106C|nr:response regulator [Singulisphaera sp. GP187]SIO07724.1 Response regulator receiver domain-containing protein [Singulisphaera sp. GP187]